MDSRTLYIRSHLILCEEGVVIGIPILQMKKLNHRKQVTCSRL